MMHIAANLATGKYTDRHTQTNYRMLHMRQGLAIAKLFIGASEYGIM